MLGPKDTSQQYVPVFNIKFISSACPSNLSIKAKYIIEYFYIQIGHKRVITSIYCLVIEHTFIYVKHILVLIIRFVHYTFASFDKANNYTLKPMNIDEPVDKRACINELN